MRKYNVCILFGGMSPEHAVSLRSAESVLNNLNPEKYNIYPVGITRDGQWYLYRGEYGMLPGGAWEENPDNCPVAISPVRGQGLLCFEETGVSQIPLDVVFPVLHGENGEDGAIQGLMQLAGIPCVGPNVSASAVSMDKTLTKLVVDHIRQPQAAWMLVRRGDLHHRMETILAQLQEKFSFPMFVKPAGTGSSVGVSKAADRTSLEKALLDAGKFDEKILVEEFIHGREIEVAVMGNENPVASVCGEIDSGADFYDYDAKYITDTSTAYIPARISEDVEEIVVGQPKTLRNEPSESMKYINPFLGQLRKELPDMKVTMFDERFTSSIAHREMLAAGMKKSDRQRKELADEMAATIILTDYLQSRSFSML